MVSWGFVQGCSARVIGSAVLYALCLCWTFRWQSAVLDECWIHSTPSGQVLAAMDSPPNYSASLSFHFYTIFSFFFHFTKVTRHINQPTKQSKISSCFPVKERNSLENVSGEKIQLLRHRYEGNLLTFWCFREIAERLIQFGLKIKVHWFLTLETATFLPQDPFSSSAGVLFYTYIWNVICLVYLVHSCSIFSLKGGDVQ